jgi:hypothetical protein
MVGVDLWAGLEFIEGINGGLTDREDLTCQAHIPMDRNAFAASDYGVVVAAWSQ